ncbi:MAG TPA: tetratricopeptide repeat protein [Rhizomicrobium sp.]|jgi:tetratricopeptide (TPR) repeat protein
MNCNGIWFGLAAALAIGATPAYAAPQSSGCGADPSPVYSLHALIVSCTQAARGTAEGWGHGMGLVSTPPEDRAWAFYQRGLYYQFDHQYDRAIADYTTALGFEHNYEDALAARADAYEQSGDHPHAEADYTQADALRADNAQQLNSRCWARAIRGFPLDKALADCTASLTLKSDDPNVFDSRCLVNYRLGNYAAAISDCSENLKRYPSAAGSLYVRGLAKIKSGDTGGGNADLKAASDADWRIEKLYAFWGVSP